MFIHLHSLIQHRDLLGVNEESKETQYAKDDWFGLCTTKKTHSRRLRHNKLTKDDFDLNHNSTEEILQNQKVVYLLDFSRQLINLDLESSHQAIFEENLFQQQESLELKARELLYTLPVIYCSLQGSKRYKVIKFYREMLSRSKPDDLISCFGFMEYFRQFDGDSPASLSVIIIY